MDRIMVTVAIVMALIPVIFPVGITLPSQSGFKTWSPLATNTSASRSAHRPVRRDP